MRRLAVFIAALAVCGCTTTVPAIRPAPAARLPASRFIVGAAASSEEAFMRATGVRPGVVEHYIEPGDPFSGAFAGSAIPLIQITPFSVSMTRITTGDEDTWLRAYATAVIAYRKPVIIGFAPEMNGSWYSWGYGHATPAQYIAAWRHVVTVFRSAGALNVTWLWTVNVAAIGSGDSLVSDPAPWWPGAAWVGCIGIDGYYYYSSENFSGIFSSTLAEVRGLGRPVLISETAVAPAAGQASKLADLFSGAAADHLRGLLYFDLPGNEDWPLTTAATGEFRKLAREYGS